MKTMKSIASIFFTISAFSALLASSASSKAFAFFSPGRFGFRQKVSVRYLPDNELENQCTIESTFSANKQKPSGVTLVTPEVLDPYSMLRQKASLSRVMTARSNASKTRAQTTVATTKKTDVKNSVSDNHSHPLNLKLFYTGSFKFLSAENEKPQFKMLRQRSALLNLMKSDEFRSSLIQEVYTVATVISAPTDDTVTDYNDDHSHKIHPRFMYTGSVGLVQGRKLRLSTASEFYGSG